MNFSQSESSVILKIAKIMFFLGGITEKTPGFSYPDPPRPFYSLMFGGSSTVSSQVKHHFNACYPWEARTEKTPFGQNLPKSAEKLRFLDCFFKIILAAPLVKT